MCLTFPLSPLTTVSPISSHTLTLVTSPISTPKNTHSNTVDTSPTVYSLVMSIVVEVWSVRGDNAYSWVTTVPLSSSPLLQKAEEGPRCRLSGVCKLEQQKLSYIQGRSEMGRKVGMKGIVEEGRGSKKESVGGDEGSGKGLSNLT
ncbi:hypothetical protein Tco_0852668 [Tanacetum coccineum]